MPHFLIETDETGTIDRILKDGQQHDQAVRLEQVFLVVSVYFKLADLHLEQMAGMGSEGERRHLGLQCFLMSLIGLEAFTNTYFQLRAKQLKSNDILDRVNQRHGSLTEKIEDLLELTFDRNIHDQEQLLERVRKLSRLRNEIVHPRWEPSSVTLPDTVHIEDLVQSRIDIFEDIKFCREAMYWCLLIIARIAEAQGKPDVSGFMFHWTGQYGMTLAGILQVLEIKPD